MHGSFEVWLLNGCGLNLCFPKAFEQSTRFPRRKFGDTSLTFAAEIMHCFTFGDMDCDNHIGKGEHVYIIIHHAQC